MILYRCKVCNCIFGIEKKYIQHKENEEGYISCPLDGRHRIINAIGNKDLKKLMEECKGVLL